MFGAKKFLSYSLVVLALAPFSCALADMDGRKGERPKESPSKAKRALVTSVPTASNKDFNNSIASVPYKELAEHAVLKGESTQFPTIAAPTVKVGDKDISMSPWVPVRQSLGVQMELVW